MLRQRILLAILGLAAITAVLLAAVVWVADEWIEDAALEDLLAREMDFLVSAGVAPADLARSSSTLVYFRSGHLPAPPPALAALPAGIAEEARIGGGGYRVLVRDLGPGDRAWLAYPSGFVEHRERRLRKYVLGAALLLLGLALWSARKVGDAVLAPLDRLVAQLRSVDPEKRGARLAAPSEDPEILTIVTALNRYIGQRDEVVERERAFAAAASHELRTPLSLIQGSAEMIAADPAHAAVPLARLQRAVTEVRHALDALLAFSRARESPARESLDLAQWLPELGAVLAEEAGGAVAIEWAVTGRPILEAPAGAPAIVFSNLLRNALRAARAGGGHVRVEIAPGRVRLEDDGPGIAPGDLPRLFEPGYRGSDGGSGMGLYISRVLADRFGWSLALGNREGRGAVADWRF